MSMDKKTVEAALTMLPVAIDLVTRLITFAEAAKNDGYDVPSIEELKGLNDKLKELPDL